MFKDTKGIVKIRK